MVRNKNEPQKGLNRKVDVSSSFQGTSSMNSNGVLSASQDISNSSRDHKQGLLLNSGSYLKIGPKMSAKDLININNKLTSNGSSSSKNGVMPSSSQSNGFNKDNFDRQLNGNGDTSNGLIMDANSTSTIVQNGNNYTEFKTDIAANSSKVLNQNQQLSHWKNQAYIYKRMFGVYKEGQNVLTRWSDGLYYLGKICKVSQFSS